MALHLLFNFQNSPPPPPIPPTPLRNNFQNSPSSILNTQCCLGKLLKYFYHIPMISKINLIIGLWGRRRA